MRSITLLPKEFEYEGKFFRLIEPLSTLCCSYIFQTGEVIEVVRKRSNNRLIVKTKGSISLHKVKKSSLNRCGKLLY